MPQWSAAVNPSATMHDTKQTRLPGGKGSLRLHAAFVGMAFVLPLVVRDESVSLLIIGAVCCGLYLLIAKREAKCSQLLITPISWYFVMQALTCGLGAVVIALTASEDKSIQFTRFRVPLSDVLSGYQIYLLGALALHRGLQTFRPRFARSIPCLDPRSRRQSARSILFCVLFGIGVQWAPGLTLNFGLVAGTFSMLTLAAACSALLNPPKAIPEGSVHYWAAALALTLAALAAEASMQLKYFIILAALPVCWALLIRGRRRWLLAPFGCALLAAYILVIEPTITEIRSEGRPTDDRVATATLQRMGQRVWSFADPATTLLTNQDAAQSTYVRAFPATPVGFLVGQVRSSGFQYGGTMAYLVYSFVPRVFWHDKPATSRGAWFTYYLGQAHSEDNATSATAISAAGELYWNFGYLGVVIGMFVLGSLYSGLLWRQAGTAPARTPLHMLAYLNAMLLASGEAEAGGALIFVVGYFLVLRASSKVAEWFSRHPWRGLGQSRRPLLAYRPAARFEGESIRL